MREPIMPTRGIRMSLVVPLAVLAACSSTPKVGGSSGLQVVSASELPSPERGDLAATTVPYYVGPFDRLTVDVFGIEELSNRDVLVDSEGRISFPVAGIVEVSGKTPVEIEGLIADRLKFAYVRDPQVTVNLKEMVSQRLTIEGEVQNPGLYPVIGRMTLLRAVAQAKGTTEFTKLNDVVVFRTVNRQRLAALYDLNAIRHGAYADPEVFAGDIVMVGESRGRRLFKDVLQALPVLTGPLIVALK